MAWRKVTDPGSSNMYLVDVSRVQARDVGSSAESKPCNVHESAGFRRGLCQFTEKMSLADDLRNSP